MAVIYIISSFISNSEKTAAPYKKAGLNSPAFFIDFIPLDHLQMITNITLCLPASSKQICTDHSLRTHLESEPQPGVDAPLFVDVAAEAARHFAVEVARFADPDVAAQAQLEPGVAIIVVLGQHIMCAA